MEKLSSLRHLWKHVNQNSALIHDQKSGKTPEGGMELWQCRHVWPQNFGDDSSPSAECCNCSFCSFFWGRVASSNLAKRNSNDCVHRCLRWSCDWLISFFLGLSLYLSLSLSVCLSLSIFLCFCVSFCFSLFSLSHSMFLWFSIALFWVPSLSLSLHHSYVSETQ